MMREWLRVGAGIAAVGALSVCAMAQTAARETPATTAMRFEVVSVRPAPPNRSTMRYSVPMGARVSETGMPLDQLIQLAFGLERRDLEAPEWTRTAQYDIEATTEGGVSLTREQMQPLMQQLLMERFGLKYHMETHEVSGYALVVGKGGPKLEASEQKEPGAGSILRDGLQLPSASMKMLAAVLGYPLGQVPVVDKTGLTGLYAIKLKYAAAGDMESTLPSVFTAVEELGLKLEPQKVTVHMLVVDHVEKTPTGN